MVNAINDSFLKKKTNKRWRLSGRLAEQFL